MIGLWRGLTHAAWLVGLVRGIVEAAVMAGILAAAAWVTSSEAPAALAPYAGSLFLVFRFLEGLADQIDPAKQRAPDGP